MTHHAHDMLFEAGVERAKNVLVQMSVRALFLVHEKSLNNGKVRAFYHAAAERLGLTHETKLVHTRRMVDGLNHKYYHCDCGGVRLRENVGCCSDCDGHEACVFDKWLIDCKRTTTKRIGITFIQK